MKEIDEAYGIWADKNLECLRSLDEPETENIASADTHKGPSQSRDTTEDEKLREEYKDCLDEIVAYRNKYIGKARMKYNDNHVLPYSAGNASPLPLQPVQKWFVDGAEVVRPKIYDGPELRQY